MAYDKPRDANVNPPRDYVPPRTYVRDTSGSGTMWIVAAAIIAAVAIALVYATSGTPDMATAPAPAESNVTVQPSQPAMPPAEQTAPASPPPATGDQTAPGSGATQPATPPASGN